jgi:hypothetical protein
MMRSASADKLNQLLGKISIFSEPFRLGDDVVVCPVALNGGKYGLIRQ